MPEPSPDGRDRRLARLEQRLERLDALIASLEADREIGPFWQLVERIEREVTGAAPGPVAQLEAALGDLGVDEEDLPLGERAGTLRLAFALQRELGRRLPLEMVLGVVPGLSGSLVEKGLLLPISIGLASAWRMRSDPQAMARRVRRLRTKRARVARRLERREG